MGWVVFWVLCGVASAIIGGNKGRPGFVWFLFGCLVGPFGILLALTGESCSGVPSSYGQDRLRDLSDVVDVRYGTGVGLGLGVQFGDIFRTGVGCSTEWYQRQWFGRKSVEVHDGLFAYGVIIGYDGDYLRRLGPGEWVKEGSAATGSFNMLLLTVTNEPKPSWSGDETWFTQPGGDPPLLTTGRIGGAIFLPAANAGLYLNVGEIADFFGGIVGFDLLGDDGYPKYSPPEAPATPASSAGAPVRPGG